MTSREKVLKVYPDATLTAEAFAGWCIYEGGPRPNNRMTGFHSEFEAAWDELASKLPPGSPAGETARKYRLQSGGDGATDKIVDEPNLRREIHDLFCSCGNPDTCDNEYLADFDDSFPAQWQENGGGWDLEDGWVKFTPIAVPEPVPTEGAVPPVFNKDRQLVDEVSKLPFSRRYAIYRNIKKTVICTPSAPEAAAAGYPNIGERYEARDGGILQPRLVDTVNDQIVYTHSDSEGAEAVSLAQWNAIFVAPIAPAAEELIQELVRVMESVMPALPHHRRTAIRVAVARAEEYRKGAKNA